jgi:hypothetical protein
LRDSQEGDALATFARNSYSGALTYAGVKKDGVDGVNGLNGARGAAVVSPDGMHVYVAGYSANAWRS